MTFPSQFNIATGLADWWRSVKVEGRNTQVAQDFVPICPSGLYRTPQSSGAVQLRIRAGGNANDTATGSGAREVELYGVDASGLEIREALATNGELASGATSSAFMRLMGARVGCGIGLLLRRFG